jgi:hypothetical protein
VALAKKYCRSDEYSAEWISFIGDEILKIRQFMTGPAYANKPPDKPSLNVIVNKMMALTEVLGRSMLVCGRWGTPEAIRTASRGIQTLVLSPTAAGYVTWNSLRDFRRRSASIRPSRALYTATIFESCAVAAPTANDTARP